MPPSAISFDLGHTLVDFDELLLAEQARRRGLWLAPARALDGEQAAWQEYNRAKAEGTSGFEAWAAFVRELLVWAELSTLDPRTVADAQQREDFVRYLWSEQPENNLWRKPVPGMLELVQRLSAQGVKIGVLTNSEGRAKELVDTTGFGTYVTAVVDSGVEGIEKPDPRIFSLMAERLGCDVRSLLHVGDSFEADVLGALGAGATPIWFVREPTLTLPPGVLWCRDTQELSRCLEA